MTFDSPLWSLAVFSSTRCTLCNIKRVQAKCGVWNVEYCCRTKTVFRIPYSSTAHNKPYSGHRMLFARAPLSTRVYQNTQQYFINIHGLGRHALNVDIPQTDSTAYLRKLCASMLRFWLLEQTTDMFSSCIEKSSSFSIPLLNIMAKFVLLLILNVVN